MKIYFRLLFVVLLVISISCGQKGAESTEYTVEEEVVQDSDEWPELDEFHMIMAESFHPYKDSMNLDPAKANAAEMANVAGRWAEAALPSKVNNEEVKAVLAQLKTEAADFSTLAASGSAEEIGAALTKLHDTFHKIQEHWYGGGEKHHGAEEHEHEEEH